MITEINYKSQEKLLIWVTEGGIQEFEVDLIVGDTQPVMIYHGEANSCSLDISPYDTTVSVVVKQKKANGGWDPFKKDLKK